MTSDNDLWDFPAGWRPMRINPIRVLEHRDVQPFANETGAYDHWGIPPALLAALKQPCDATTDGSDPHFYAVMDGAITPNLPDMLSVSGLPHKCLFTGAALAESGAVAPWLVEIRPENRFVRRLFTKGVAPWMLWDKSAGFFLASPFEFETVWKHLRKLTRLRDADGIWYYFRFWDRIAAKALARAAEISPNAIQGLTAPFSTILMKTGPNDFVSLHRDINHNRAPVQSNDLIAILKPVMTDIKLREDVAVIAHQIAPERAELLTDRLMRWALLGIRNASQLTHLGEFEAQSPQSLLDRADIMDIIRASGATDRTYTDVINHLGASPPGIR